MNHYRINLNGTQKTLITMALRQVADWYEKNGGGELWFAERASENRMLADFMDSQRPETTGGERSDG